MKKVCNKVLVCTLLALIVLSTISMYMPVKAALMSYEDFNFSFTGGCSVATDCSGMFMDVRVKATASNNNNETITLKVYVTNTGSTKTYTFLSDGQLHEYRNIFLGFSGGSNVRLTFTGANPAITIYVYADVTS